MGLCRHQEEKIGKNFVQRFAGPRFEPAALSFISRCTQYVYTQWTFSITTLAAVNSLYNAQHLWSLKFATGVNFLRAVVHFVIRVIDSA